jgi:hypothetical protein
MNRTHSYSSKEWVSSGNFAKRAVFPKLFDLNPNRRL